MSRRAPDLKLGHQKNCKVRVQRTWENMNLDCKYTTAKIEENMPLTNFQKGNFLHFLFYFFTSQLIVCSLQLHEILVCTIVYKLFRIVERRAEGIVYDIRTCVEASILHNLKFEFHSKAFINQPISTDFACLSVFFFFRI